MILLQILFTVGLILLFQRLGWEPAHQAVGPALGLLLSLAVAAVAKALLLRKLLEAPVSGWRWQLVWAAAAAILVGSGAVLLPEWLELSLGIPAILLAFGGMLWWRGFTKEDRELFRMRKADIEQMSVPDPSTGGGSPR